MFSKEEMLSCPPKMGFPRNHWYVGAFSSELGRTILKRRLLGDQVLMYRTEAGDPVALADRCPHRGLPLSNGVLEGDVVRCGYHGMAFGGTGACVEVPSQSAIPSSMSVRSYPMVERSLWVWIWMGDPELADPALIPDHQELGLEREGWEVTEMFRMDVPGNYQLLHENLLDVSHITYLHPMLLDDGDVGPAKSDVKFTRDRITISREIDELANAGTSFAFGLKEGKRYRRTLTTWTKPPALTVVSNTYIDIENPDAPPRVLSSPFGITPASATETHLFFTTATSYPGKQSPEQIGFVWNVFEQDNVAIKAIQELFVESGIYGPEVSVKADAAALRCRLRNVDLIERELVPA